MEQMLLKLRSSQPQTAEFCFDVSTGHQGEKAIKGMEGCRKITFACGKNPPWVQAARRMLGWEPETWSCQQNLCHLQETEGIIHSTHHR